MGGCAGAEIAEEELAVHAELGADNEELIYIMWVEDDELVAVESVVNSRVEMCRGHRRG